MITYFFVAPQAFSSHFLKSTYQLAELRSEIKELKDLVQSKPRT